MPAPTVDSDALTTLANVKYALQIPQGTTTFDDSLATMINLASKSIEARCRRQFKQATYTDKRYSGNGECLLFLPQYPVISVTSIYLDGVLQVAFDPDAQAGDYILHAEHGILERPAGWSRGRQNIKVTHVANFATIPPAVAEICIAWVSRVFKGQLGGVQDQSMDGYRVAFGAGIPPEILEALGPWVANSL